MQPILRLALYCPDPFHWNRRSRQLTRGYNNQEGFHLYCSDCGYSINYSDVDKDIFAKMRIDENRIEEKSVD